MILKIIRVNKAIHTILFNKGNSDAVIDHFILVLAIKATNLVSKGVIN